jgi:hypothetical protein
MVMQNRSLRNVEIRREMERTLILAALVAWTWPVLAADLPTNPAVTQVTIATTICVSGWTKTVRPSAWETARIKIKRNCPGSFGRESGEAQGFREVLGIGLQGVDDFPALLSGGREEGADRGEVARALL